MLEHEINQIFFKNGSMRSFVCAVLGAFGGGLAAILLFYPLLGSCEGVPISEKDLAGQLKFYRSVEELKADFKQTKHLSEMNLDLKSEGHLSFRKPDRVVWEVVKPSPVKVSLSKDEIEIKTESDVHTYKMREISQDHVAKGLGLLWPWLTFDTKALSEQYKMSKISDLSFEFEPKTSGLPVGKIQASLTKDGHLDRLKLFENSGDWMEIQFGRPKIVRKKI